MARPRKSNKHLPPCVYLNHGAYFYVRDGRWELLGRDLPAALAEYARKFGAPKGSMPALLEEWFAGASSRLAPATRAQYKIAVKKLAQIFAEFSPEQVKPVHVAQMKRALADTPNMANRVLSVLRQVFDYALEEKRVEINPTVGVRRHKEAKRERLLSEDELERVLDHCGPRLRCVVDLCYQTAQRIGDVLRIRITDLVEEGIAFDQQKTGARLVVRWTPELRETVARAKALGGNVRALTLLYNRRGKPPDYRTVKLQWDEACRRAGVEDAHLHDIRAMAATEAKRQGLDPQALLGHTDAATTRIYLRGREVPVVSGPTRRTA